MKDLIWDEILSVGVEEVDEDHRRLLELFNLLNRATEAGRTPEYVAAVLEELIHCTAWHFSHEERLMLEHGYEGLAEHRQEHRELMQGVRALQQKVQQTGVTQEDLQYLERWLTQHILSEDGRMGAYLSQVM